MVEDFFRRELVPLVINAMIEINQDAVDGDALWQFDQVFGISR